MNLLDLQYIDIDKSTEKHSIARGCRGNKTPSKSRLPNCAADIHYNLRIQRVASAISASQTASWSKGLLQKMPVLRSTANNVGPMEINVLSAACLRACVKEKINEHVRNDCSSCGPGNFRDCKTSGMNCVIIPILLQGKVLPRGSGEHIFGQSLLGLCG